MRKPQYIGVKHARSQLSALLVEATKGHSTVITCYGKPVAAIVPVGQLAASSAQRSLLSVAGSGKGLWGATGADSVSPTTALFSGTPMRKSAWKPISLIPSETGVQVAAFGCEALVLRLTADRCDRPAERPYRRHCNPKHFSDFEE